MVKKKNKISPEISLAISVLAILVALTQTISNTDNMFFAVHTLVFLSGIVAGYFVELEIIKRMDSKDKLDILSSWPFLLVYGLVTAALFMAFTYSIKGLFLFSITITLILFWSLSVIFIFGFSLLISLFVKELTYIHGNALKSLVRYNLPIIFSLILFMYDVAVFVSVLKNIPKDAFYTSPFAVSILLVEKFLVCFLIGLSVLTVIISVALYPPTGLIHIVKARELKSILQEYKTILSTVCAWVLFILAVALLFSIAATTSEGPIPCNTLPHTAVDVGQERYLVISYPLPYTVFTFHKNLWETTEIRENTLYSIPCSKICKSEIKIVIPTTGGLSECDIKQLKDKCYC